MLSLDTEMMQLQSTSAILKPMNMEELDKGPSK
jgi:hypothetical protein